MLDNWHIVDHWMGTARPAMGPSPVWCLSCCWFLPIRSPCSSRSWGISKRPKRPLFEIVFEIRGQAATKRPPSHHQAACFVHAKRLNFADRLGLLDQYPDPLSSCEGGSRPSTPSLRPDGGHLMTSTPTTPPNGEGAIREETWYFCSSELNKALDTEWHWMTMSFEAHHLHLLPWVRPAGRQRPFDSSQMALESPCRKNKASGQRNNSKSQTGFATKII